MAVGYGTTIEEMQRAAQQVAAVNERVQADLSALRNQLAPLAGAWRGEASRAFQGLMARWDADARKLNDALRDIGESIQGSGQSYARQEEQQAQSLSAISGALG
ncbi:MAG: WXG100 family type VII secretion target [Pseudonocardia sp.]